MYTGKTPAVFTRSPKQYSHVNFNNNNFSGNIIGLDNLPDRKDISATTSRKRYPKDLNFPWTYIPAKLRNVAAQFPESLYNSFTKE